LRGPTSKAGKGTGQGGVGEGEGKEGREGEGKVALMVMWPSGPFVLNPPLWLLDYY